MLHVHTAFTSKGIYYNVLSSFVYIWRCNAPFYNVIAVEPDQCDTEWIVCVWVWMKNDDVKPGNKVLKWDTETIALHLLLSGCRDIVAVAHHQTESEMKAWELLRKYSHAYKPLYLFYWMIELVQLLLLLLPSPLLLLVNDACAAIVVSLFSVDSLFLCTHFIFCCIWSLSF